MPGLIQRHNAVAEYSALISTNPNAVQLRHRRRLERDARSSFSPRTAAIREEASDWYEAFAPPLEDLQAFVRRMQADPDLAQDALFAQLWPVVVLCALFAVAVIAVREESYIHRILDAPDNFWVEVGRFVALAVCFVVCGVLLLKCVIYGVAELSNMILSLETKEQMGKKEKRGVVTSGLVLDGMFM